MSRRSPWLQIAMAYAVLEVAFWTENGAQAKASLVAAAVIIVLTFLDGRPASQLGLQIRALPRSLWLMLIAAIAAGGMVLIALAAGSLHPIYGQHSFWQHALTYFVWATVQQFLLQSFFYVRVEQAVGNNRKTVLITAGLFAAAHVPNPVLAPATFVGALIFCEFFRQHRTIFPLAAAHATLGLAIAVAVPDAILHHMRVGMGYLHFP